MLMGAAGPAILAGFLDGQRARERALEQQARDQSLRLDVLYGFGCIQKQIVCHIPVDDERVRVEPVAPVEFPCLSCGASRTEYQRGRRRCAYCGSDR